MSTSNGCELRLGDGALVTALVATTLAAVVLYEVGRRCCLVMTLACHGVLLLGLVQK